MKRVLATALALAVSGSLLTLVPATAHSDTTEPRVDEPPRIAGSSGDVPRAVGAAVPDSRRTRQTGGHQWPVALQVANLWYYEDEPTGAPAQQFASARVRQDRRDGTVDAWVTLEAAPDAATNSLVFVWFGRINSATNQCVADEAAGVEWQSWGQSAANLDRNGASMRLYDFPVPGARTLAWNCAFAETRSLDRATVYDVRSNHLSRVLARPRLVVKAADKRVAPRTFVRLPVRVTNKASALGRAPNARLAWSGRGLAVRGSHKLGTIRPGKTERQVLRVRLDQRRKAILRLVVRTGDIRKVKRVVIRPR